ncbi:MAG: cysteine desulfurase family protein [Ghiorsea sp.]|nr:cysteine desulfurase family protein [Ghiorsea sp.]
MTFQNKHIYLDYNATCPQLPQVTTAMQDVVETAFGNPSSLHWAGRNARRRLDDARDTIANYFAVDAGSIVFTSGGTESNNMVIQGMVAGSESGHIVLSAIEHPAVLQAVEQWCMRYPAWTYTLVKPDKGGRIDAESFMAACQDNTKLACLMWVNNETGVVQPVFEVSQHCREQGVSLFVDAVQALGKFEINLKQLDADFVSFSAHKIGGPRGVGALIMQRGVKLESLMIGGGQERGRRSGTENVAGVFGFATARGQQDYTSIQSLRDMFEAKLLAAIPDVRIFGQSHQRTANTSMFCVPGLEGETLLMQMDLMGFAVASGSACSSGKREPSHVLLAMGLPEHQARSSLRVSFGLEHDEETADALIAALCKIKQRLRQMSGR